MNIFLDVGSHSGQSLKEFIRKCYRFDVIHCFEPMPGEYRRLTQKYKTSYGNKKVIYHNYGLLDRNCTLDMYGTNVDKGSSIFPNKQRMVGRELVTRCEFKRASDFFAENIHEDDLVIVKINVEGSECIIMNDLLDTGECNKIDDVMIDFDIRKVPDKLNDEKLLLERMKREGFTNFSLCDEVMIGSNNQKRLRHWLKHSKYADRIIEPGIGDKLKRLLVNFHVGSSAPR